jgi:hypothetical protein
VYESQLAADADEDELLFTVKFNVAIFEQPDAFNEVDV